MGRQKIEDSITFYIDTKHYVCNVGPLTALYTVGVSNQPLLTYYSLPEEGGSTKYLHITDGIIINM